FKEFETAVRGFVDVTALVKVAKTGGNPLVRLIDSIASGNPSTAEFWKGVNPIARVIDELGLDGLKNGTFYYGFDGEPMRSLIEFEMPSPRKGVFRLIGKKSCQLKDAPAVPPDALRWAMMDFDAEAVYDTGVQLIETVLRLTSPDEVAKFQETLKQADETLS